MVKKWLEIKEQAETLSIYECDPLKTARLLRDLVGWLDNRFYGEQTMATVEYLKTLTQIHKDLYSNIPKEEE